MKNIFKYFKLKAFRTNAKKWKTYELSTLKVNDVITENTILIGEGHLNLILKPNIQVLINGTYQGIIIGTQNNKIQLNGAFKGLISTELINIKKSSTSTGRIFANKMIIEKGATLSSLSTQGNLQQIHPSLNFDSVEIFQNDKILSIYNEI